MGIAKSNSNQKAVRTLSPNFFAFLWGFAEATVFFIVPDVLIGWEALLHWRKGMSAILFSILGAMLGGLAMYAFGLWDGATAEKILTSIPLIHASMVQSVTHQLQAAGLPAILTGPLQGIPYKIYAVESGRLGLSLLAFLLLTIPARGARFLLVASLAVGFRALFPRMMINHPRVTASLYLFVWAAFYLMYFLLIGHA